MYGRHGFGRFGRGFGCEPPRMRRGDMKFLLLEILKEGPRHGYEIINGLEGQFRGYRPSPGSVYPTLQMLEERGETRFEETPGMKQAFEVRKSLNKLAMAVVDGMRGTDTETMKKIEEIVNKARKEVYSILAES